MRTLLSLAALALLAAPAAAQQDTSHKDMNKGMAGMHMEDKDQAVQGGGTLPDGWSARTDRNAPMSNVKFITMGSGFHVTLGPAVILYRQADMAKGPFHTLATFIQTKATAHPEAYGLFYNGQNLTGANQQYTYFLVRQDGKYLIKGRTGDSTYVIQNWTASPAVNQIDSSHKSSTNKLEVDAKSQPGKVRYLVNGTEVYSASAKPSDLMGIVGLRVNHNLDVHIDGFAVHQ